MKTFWIALIGVGFLAGSGAYGQDADKKAAKKIGAKFKKLDTNEDGKLSKEEFVAGLPEKAKEKGDALFGKLDADNDGSISKEEFAKGMAKKGKGKKKKKDGDAAPDAN